jgi:hypothetical protein
MSKQICLNRAQNMRLLDFLGNTDNFPIFDRKTFQEIADIAAVDLEFEISQSTVRGIWHARKENNLPVWEAPERKKKMSVAEEIAGLKEVIKEQDKKFKTVFRRLHELSQATAPRDDQESFHFNNGGGDGAELVD